KARLQHAGQDYEAIAVQACAVKPTRTMPKLIQAMPSQRAGEIGSPNTRLATITTPTNCDAAKTCARLSGTRRSRTAKRRPRQPNKATPAPDRRRRTQKKFRGGAGTPAPSFTIRWAAPVKEMTAAKPTRVVGASTA